MSNSNHNQENEERRYHERRENYSSCTSEEQRQIIKDTVKETLLLLGLDISDPISIQRDFTHLREWRESTEKLKENGMIAMVGIVVAATLTAFWIGIKQQLGVK
jgi:hypothetical protein